MLTDNGVRDSVEERFEMCNNTFQDVYNNLGSRIPASARIRPEIDFLFHDKKMWRRGRRAAELLGP